MDKDSKFTRDEEGYVAVRVVSGTEALPAVDKDYMFARDTNGNIAVRVVGASGGGSVDESKIIVLSGTMPTADASSLGKFYCYKGATNQNYTHGYVYECVANEPVYTDSVEFEPATLSGTVITATSGAVANLCSEYITGDITEIVSGTMTYDNASDLWVFVGKDSENNTVGMFQIYQLDYEDAGFTFTGTPEDGDVVTFTCSIEETGATYTWTRVNLQPGSEHDLGFFDTVAELQTAHPTGSAGDFALIGATDTFWVWDTTTSAWVDSHKADAVTSVNGQTGAVTLGINDVAPTQTDKSGYVLGTDGFVAGWIKPEIVQRSVLPAASEEEVDNIYQFVGTTDANYTNGYFYKCVSDGLNPATYSWENIEVQEVEALPSQTGQSGKFLTTDGTDASWSDRISKLDIVYKNSIVGALNFFNSNNNSTAELKTNGTPGMRVFLRGRDTRHTFTYYVDDYAFWCYYSTDLPILPVRTPDLGTSSYKWGTLYVTKVNNGADIDVPNTSGTMVVADYTGATAGQVLTLDNNLSPVWSAPSGGGSVPTLTWYSVSTAGNTLTIADTSSAQLVKIYKNGLLLQPTEDYTISGTTLTTVAALVVGDKITTEVF